MEAIGCLEASLLGLEDQATLARPWSSLTRIERAACAALQQRVSQHTDSLLESDAGVTARTLSAVRAELRSLDALAGPSEAGVSPAKEPCAEQLAATSTLLKAAARHEQVLVAEVAERVDALLEGNAAQRAVRDDALRASADGATACTEELADARETLTALAADSAREHAQRLARMEVVLDRTRRRLAAEEAKLAPSCERLRASASSARDLCRRREEGHAAALNRLRQPVHEAVRAMKKAAASGALRGRREQIDTELHSLRREWRAQHVRWLHATQAQVDQTAALVESYLDAAERARARQQPLREQGARRAERVHELQAVLQQVAADLAPLALALGSVRGTPDVDLDE